MIDTRNLNVDVIPLSDCAGWQSLLEESYCSTLFHEDWFLRHLGIERLLIVTEGSEILGGMPLFDNVDGLATIQSGLMVPYCGPVIRKRYSTPRQQMHCARQVYLRLITHLNDHFQHVQFILSPGHMDVVPFVQNGYFPELRFTYRCINPLERNLMSKGRRSDLNRFENFNIEIEEDLNIAHFDISAACAWNPDFEYTHKSELIMRDAIAQGKGRAFVAQSDGDALGGLFILSDGHDCFSTHSYFTKDAKNRGVSTALYTHAVATHFDEGCRGTFDFEGSVLKGVESFYQSFGAVQTPYVALHWKPRFSDLNIEEIFEY